MDGGGPVHWTRRPAAVAGSAHECTRLVLFAGSDAACTHPSRFARLARARDAHARWLVVDPRRTATAAQADLHLAIQPGTDVTLFNGMLHHLVWEGLLDQAFIDSHTEGFDALKRALRDFDPRTAASVCGITVDNLTTAAEWFGRSRSVLSLHGGGLVRPAHGEDALRALHHLHLACGQLGQPGGAGLYPLATGTGPGEVMAGIAARRLPARAHRFQPLGHRAPAEPVSARFPLRLLTGRLPAQVSIDRAAAAADVQAGMPSSALPLPQRPTLRLHPADAQRRGLAPGELVRVSGRHGQFVLPLEPSHEVNSGTAFATIRPCALATADDADEACVPAADFEHAAVRLERAGLGWHLLAARRGDARALRAALRPLLRECGYAAAVLHRAPASAAAWVVVHAAAAQPMPADWLAALVQALALHTGPDTLEYRDPRRGLERRVAWRRSADAEHVDGLLWAGTDAGGNALLATALAGNPWRGPRMAAFSAASTPARVVHA
ncbi:molybdopterin oxidoreductase family protein [Pseudoxanthomonas koreensis]|uniref:molybdopterin oxidoreductase family protein n=2 Tax=Pseudoxanthomonas koreensis TaxID=266061 RepID=UPI0035A6A4E9